MSLRPLTRTEEEVLGLVEEGLDTTLAVAEARRCSREGAHFHLHALYCSGYLERRPIEGTRAYHYSVSDRS